MLNRILLAFSIFLSPLAAKEGIVVNPFTDVCWECLFPITISGVNTTPGYKDHTKYNQALCFCHGTPPKAGIPITYFEPAYLIDVTRHAYKLLGLGGISIGKETIKNRGVVGVNLDTTTKQSFYHVHFYKFPILKILELLTDFDCLESGDPEIFYMSEFDTLWNNDHWQFSLNPEAVIFSSQLAHLACLADCASANITKPLDKLFWCAGCEGSLYPFTGVVPSHIGAVQASALLVHRVLAKCHRSFLLRGFEKNEFCEAKFMPIIKKSLYKTQLVYPIPHTKGPCPCLGKSDLFWGAGKSFPVGGEDFVYLIWKKNQCCLDAVKPALSTLPNGGRS